MTTVGGLVESAAADAARGRVGVVVSAWHEGEEVTAGAGVLTQGGSCPDGRTLFEIGSITKVLTALLLAESVRRGEATLDSRLAEVVDSLPAGGETITLGMLASHTSGLPRLPRGIVRDSLRHPRDPYLGWDVERLPAALPRTRLRSTPGTKVAYSNLGAALLGLALERLTGTPYAALLGERVTGPLGLHDTVLATDDDQAARRAPGHSRRGKPVPSWHLEAFAPAGAALSTAPDLVRLLRAHAEPEGSPLEESLRLVVQPRVDAHKRLQIGLGWHILRGKGPDEALVWHNGGTGGSFSWAGYHPASGTCVVALTNCARPVDKVGIDLQRSLTGAG